MAEAVRHVVSSAILFELKDPRVQGVTVTFVEVAGDLRSAKVHVSIMGTDSEQALTLKGLRNAAGFLQSRCAEKIDTRYTPRLQFVLDQGVKKSIEVSRILAEVLPREEVETDDMEEGEGDETDQANDSADADPGNSEAGPR